MFSLILLIFLNVFRDKDFRSMPKNERTAKLKEMGFTCNCYACANDLTKEKLKVYDALFLQRAGNLIWEQFCGRPPKHIHNVVKSHWDAINAYHSDPLALDVPYLMEINKDLFGMLACKVAYPAISLQCRCHDCPKDAISGGFYISSKWKAEMAQSFGSKKKK